MVYSIYPADFDEYCDAVRWNMGKHSYAFLDDTIREGPDRFDHFDRTIELDLALQTWMMEHVALYYEIRNTSLSDQLCSVMRFVMNKNDLWSTFFGEVSSSVVRRFGVRNSQRGVAYKTILSRAFFTSDDYLGIVESTGEQICGEILYAHRCAVSFCLGLTPGNFYDSRDLYSVFPILDDPYNLALKEPEDEPGNGWMCVADGGASVDVMMTLMRLLFRYMWRQFDAGDGAYLEHILLSETGELRRVLFDKARPTRLSSERLLCELCMASDSYYKADGSVYSYAWCLLDAPVSKVERMEAVRAVFKEVNSADIWLERRLKTELRNVEYERTMYDINELLSG